MKQLRGSLFNRLAENHDYCDKIEVGTGMTEYLYTDRHAYEVTRVIDQEHVYVRELDHVDIGNCAMLNKWKLVSNPDKPEHLMVKRRGQWYEAITMTKELIEELEASEDSFAKLRLFHIVGHGYKLETIKRKGKQTKYFKKNVSFGKADYYYDYEF